MKFSTLSNTLKATVFGAAMLLTANVQAALLDLTLEEQPDIDSFFIDVQYDATNDYLSMFGFASELAYNDTTYGIDDGIYALDAQIDDNGNLLGGLFSIEGTIDALGYDSGNLLTANLNAFGFSSNGILEFTLDIIGGDAMNIYNGLGGTIIGGTGFTGDFNSDWGTQYSDAVSDTGVVASAVPEPSTYLLMGLGLLTVAAAARRSRAKQA